MVPDIDLIITFRATKSITLSKQQIREEARKAEQQYSRLIDTLTYAGLHAVGRRGESLGHLLVFVSCPKQHVDGLIERERHSDFLSGLPTTPIEAGSDVQPLSPADRLRLIHAYITSTPADGGLGITPGSSEWDLVESVMALHDRDFNEVWVRTWNIRQITSVQADKIREQFGDSVALYFSFLSSYTRALIFPAILGVVFYFFGTPYSPLYSTLVFVWSVVFVEWWRVRERIISLRFGTRGSFRVEKRRAQYIPGFAWWKRELRMVASLPIILLFAGVLAALLTGIFVFEAFVTQLYTGPGHKYIAFSPTILFVALVPKFLAIYQSLAQRLTVWENHAHHSTHAASLTLKTFVLSALVAYLGLALSAFVYVPFGEGVMQVVQVWLFNDISTITPEIAFNAAATNGTTEKATVGSSAGIWDMDTANAHRKLNPGRLRDQMFAYTVTNQVVNTFVEVGLPFILRGIASFRNGKKHPQSNGKKKKVVFEDEKERGGEEEREFLERVREEVELPEYELFGDYSEMVTQFGYVALWSTIWPLAPVMALINNFLELRSDAFKMTVHNRRPIPARTDTIGPWLDTLTFLTWLAALTNSALVYLFCPRSQSHCNDPNASMSSLDKVHRHLFSASGSMRPDSGIDADASATWELLTTAILIALAASHGYMILRTIIRHIMERVVWKGSEEVKERESEEREVKEKFLQGFMREEKNSGGVAADARSSQPGAADAGHGDALGNSFWGHDEGPDEIQRISKEA
ncbi:calcium-activated chloride channel-domain-containing protein [Infundibulicybe gibba]|nr:calcium-activated chloride channel-domain-containing protein [Infundibulicybe gibba]